MPDFGDVIDQVITELHGQTTDQPMLGTLVGPIGPASTELGIDFGQQPGASRPVGLIEIGQELISVSRFDPSTGLATIAPWARGQRSTIATAHDTGAMVTVRPRYPRKHVGDTINQVIAGLAPMLFAARDLDPIPTGGIIGLGYELPADTIRVLRVDATDQLLPADLAYRHVLRDWRVRNVAGTKLLEVPKCEIYETLQVTIAAQPGRLLTEADDFALTTGLPESCVDLVVFGVIARLILSVDLARQQLTSVEAANRSDRIGVASGSQISRYYQALYQQRLDAEQTRLMQLYPIQLLRRG